MHFPHKEKASFEKGKTQPAVENLQGVLLTRRPHKVKETPRMWCLFYLARPEGFSTFKAVALKSVKFSFPPPQLPPPVPAVVNLQGVLLTHRPHKAQKTPRLWCLLCLARPEGFEPPAFGIGIHCDIQLRHGRIYLCPKSTGLLYTETRTNAREILKFFCISGEQSPPTPPIFRRSRCG